MKRSRNIITGINDLKIHFSTKAKRPVKTLNHYQTLNVPHESTQEDIKTAYYELTKKYHPDKNTAVDAKQKFQDISDAYEVLSNYNKRKQYDRDLLARGDHSGTKKFYKESSEDPMSGFRQSRQEAKFDFEAWTKAHYGETLKRTIQDKRDRVDREEYKRARQQMMAEEAQREKHTLLLLVGALLFIMSIQLFSSKNYDEDRVTKKKSNS